MSLAQAPYYWLVCDTCGVRSTQADRFTAYDSVDTAIDRAEELGWAIEPGSRHRCATCADRLDGGSAS
jgi:hypothetical protein